jgi:SAM-dependent methyltransferase
LKSHKLQGILKKNITITIENNVVYSLPKSRIPLKTTQNSFIGNIQGYLKNYGRIYYFLLALLSPVLCSHSYRQTLKTLLKKYDKKHTILNLGSGPRHLNNRKDIINVDMYNFKEVDIVADVIDLPVEDSTVDFIINIALLEHMPDPQGAVREMLRILKSGGEIFCFLPFMQPFHAAPYDFHRWTREGVKILFSHFEIVEIRIGVGPTSGMLWILQEWLACLFSFGNKFLHDIILLSIMVCTFPIKYLDLLLEKFPHADIIASGFYITAQKKSEQTTICQS